MSNYITAQSILMFATYLVLGAVLLAIFTAVYARVTPYSELEQIKTGKVAPAITMGGAMLGFTLPLLAMSFYGVNFADFLLWSIIACAIQLLVFKALYKIIPMQIEVDNKAIAIVYFFASISIGAINAFSLIPH